jgi:hypothetical protein
MGVAENLDLETQEMKVLEHELWTADNRVHVTPGEAIFFKMAAKDSIYGHVVTSNAEHMRGLGGTDPQLIQKALATLCTATALASAQYATPRGNIVKKACVYTRAKTNARAYDYRQNSFTSTRVRDDT